MKSLTEKGIIMIVSGIIIAFFPAIISSLFYVIGMAVVIFCIINIIKSLTAANTAAVVPNVIGIIIGSAITSLPHFIEMVIPLTMGLILLVNGVDYLAKAIKGKSARIANIILAVIGLGLGCDLLFNSASAGNTIRIIAGISIIGTGVYDIFTSNKKISNGNSNIIDL